MHFPAVQFVNVFKSFGNTIANKDVSFSVKKGCIHAIIGENGAGKSTLMRMLYGMVPVDSGEIWIHGHLWGVLGTPFTTCKDALNNKIGMIQQHFTLAPTESVLDNIILGTTTHYTRWLDLFKPLRRNFHRNSLLRLFSQLNLSIPLDQTIENLSISLQQKIEILKLLYQDVDILILDEPTAVLTLPEITEFFIQIQMLTQLGKTVLLITHKLKEVLDYTDYVTILRTGEVVDTLKTSQTTKEHLAALMIASSNRLSKIKKTAASYQHKLIYECEQLSIQDHQPLEATFQLKAGEVLGIAGVEGNGQKELIELLTSPQDFLKKTSGKFIFLGKTAFKLSTQHLRQLGLSIVPEDRLQEAVIPEWTLLENFILGLHRRKLFSQFGFLNYPKIEHIFSKILIEYDIYPQNSRALLRSCSGGNQQKLVMARELFFPPTCLIAAQPTRGVDLNAAAFIHKKILYHAEHHQTGTLLISSELSELLELSDHILILFNKKTSHIYEAQQLDEATLGLQLGGAI